MNFFRAVDHPHMILITPKRAAMVIDRGSPLSGAAVYTYASPFSIDPRAAWQEYKNGVLVAGAYVADEIFTHVVEAFKPGRSRYYDTIG